MEVEIKTAGIESYLYGGCKKNTDFPKSYVSFFCKLPDRLNNLPIGVTVEDVDNNFKYIFWNKKAIEMFEHSCEEVEGQNYDFYNNPY